MLKGAHRSTLNGQRPGVRARRKVPTVRGTDGHFHYCCAIFTNNKFHTLNMSLCVKGFDGSFSACSCRSSGLFCACFALPSPQTFLCPLLVLKFIISHSPCLCRILFGRKTRFAFHFALLLSRFPPRTRGNSRDSQSARPSEDKKSDVKRRRRRRPREW